MSIEKKGKIMKVVKIIIWVFTALLLISISIAVYLLFPLYAESQDWAFVQSVGGIALDRPFEKEGEWFLPVQCNVSGLKAVTTQPTAMNSGIVCTKIKAKIEERSIFLTVVTGIPREGTGASCPPAKLGAIEKGNYSVFYLSPSNHPVLLGNIAIGH
jgi:hypothetical protein